MQKKVQKRFFLFEIIPSELVALNCLYLEENTCFPQLMCKLKVLRFCISLRETFSNSIAFTVINKYGKGVVVQI